MGDHELKAESYMAEADAMVQSRQVTSVMGSLHGVIPFRVNLILQLKSEAYNTTFYYFNLSSSLQTSGKER